MAKIAVADNCGRKFSDDIIKHWETKHEVRYERGASEILAQWADIYWIDWSDNNIHYLWKLYNGDPDGNRPDGWDNNRKPLIVCRAIDWEVWIGFARSQNIVDWVDKWVCIAPHIEKKLRAEAKYSPPSKLKLIRPGVNLDKFTLKKQDTDGFQIGMVLGDLWFPKQHMMGLDIFHQLWKEDKGWRLNIRGKNEGGEYWPVMYDYYIESRGLQDAVTLYSPVAEMNSWYEGIDILLHPGMKESFCYAVGEALAKGIKVVCNDFYGSRDIWPHSILYQNSNEAIEMIITKQEHEIPGWFRSYAPDVKQMLKEIDSFLGT